MKSRKYFLIVLAVAISPNLFAGVKGQCSYKDETLVMLDGYVALAPDPFEETQKVPMIWFSTAALDHAALAKAKSEEIDEAITEQSFAHDSAELKLRLSADGKLVEGLQLYVPPGNNRSLSSNEVGQLQLKAPIVTSANGRFILTDDESLKCDLQFDLPMAGKGPPPPIAKPWGTALPAGGGEPGKVYLAMHRAVMAGDVDAMLASVIKEKADQMREARSKPDFPQMLAMIKAFEPAQVRIVSGRADGERAELQIDGKESDGASMTGVVKLLREAGKWRIENVSTKSKMSQ